MVHLDQQSIIDSLESLYEPAAVEPENTSIDPFLAQGGPGGEKGGCRGKPIRETNKQNCYPFNPYEIRNFAKELDSFNKQISLVDPRTQNWNNVNQKVPCCPKKKVIEVKPMTINKDFPNPCDFDGKMLLNCRDKTKIIDKN